MSIYGTRIGLVQVDAINDMDALLVRAVRSGCESIPPERLLRAWLPQAVYSVCSERLLIEKMQHNLLSRRFVGLNIDDPVWG